MSEEKREIKVAVAGQPNVGKSTLFNVLTGRRVHVANWPGVTVEKHEGVREYNGYLIRFTDLPGIYGFSALSLEERIARRYILEEKPDVLLVLVDSLTPERTMYLAIQALEMYPNVIVVFTKTDETHIHGIHINYSLIEKRLGVPVIPVSAATGYGIDKLLETIIKVATGEIRGRIIRVDYEELNPYIDSLVEYLSQYEDKIEYPLRWLSIRLLEGDKELEEYIRRRLGENVLNKVVEIKEEIKRIFRRDPAELLAYKRFRYIEKILKNAIIRIAIKKRRERITRYFYHPVIGPLLGISILVLIFIIAFTINTGFPLNIIFYDLGLEELGEAVENYSIGGLMESLFEYISDSLYNSLGESPGTSLLVDGVIGGIGAVLVFLPLIMIVSFFLAVLEDSGLSPRIAVSLHNLLARIGVSGHAVFPMTLSLGCNVPAVMATRAIPNPRERVRLIMTLPFIPCQARLVLILAFASALTGINGALMILYGYIAAFAAFAIVNKLLYIYDKHKGLAVEPEILLELPPIHKPLWRVVWWHVWDSTKHFLVKAGSIIFLLSIVTWFLTSYTPSLQYTDEVSDSIGAGIAKFFAPLLTPLNLQGDAEWIIMFALMIGFIAKESVLSALTIITGADTGSEALRLLGLTDPQIAAITVFTILYVPCMATLAVIYSETRSWKITFAAIALMLSVAYIGMIITYLIGLMIT